MKASETHFIEFINKNQQLVIPIYQRTYSWGINHCRQLWEDIIKVVKDNIDAHFIGSLVYVSDGLYVNTETQNYLVIDGQQRLTTLSLLFLAIRDSLNGQKDILINERQIMNQYLINEFAEDKCKNKLLLTQKDKIVFEKLLNKQDLNEDEKNGKIWLNYSFFVEQIKKAEISLDEIYSGIRRLIVVGIILDRGNDNPQLIFESLNSTGLDLSQSDLIRNYVLMGLENDLQTRIFNEYWLPMENLFSRNQNEVKFDNFMRSYLTIKMKAIPKISEVYTVFKKFAYGQSVEDLISDVYKFSKYYSCIELGTGEDRDLKELFRNIKKLKVEVSHPFLLRVYDDYKQEVINKEELKSILELVESYVFRRAICGVPTNSLNKTFASLYDEIDKENYVESAKAILALKDSHRRFPKDNEFQNEIIKKDVYHFRNCLYLLLKIEKFINNNKTEVDDNKLSIEHIMPQELNSEWQNELGEEYKRIHEEYLHTLGNLTLTGFNQEMSNYSFADKKIKGFETSGVFLNRYLMELNSWNEGEIIKRAKKISGKLTQIWQYPGLSDEVLEKYNKKTDRTETDYTIDDHEYLRGDMLDLFNMLREKIIELDPTLIKEEFKKLYVAYKLETNFVDIVPQRSRLRLSLNMPFKKIDDPNNLCKDVRDKGRWGNGEIEIGISTPGDINNVMYLIKQSFDRQKNGN